MPDDKSQRRPRDSSRINIHEDYELRYWTDRFQVFEERLRAAVDEVGVGADVVERELRG